MKIRNFSLAMVIIAIFTVAFAACPTTEILPPPTTVEFVQMGPGAVTTIDFSPSAALPTGVTYIITNDKNSKTWNNIGTVSADDFVDVDANVTFTQTFYLNNTEVGKRIVVAEAQTAFVTTLTLISGHTGPVTLFS